MIYFCKLLIYNLNSIGHTSCESHTELAVLTPAGHFDFGLQQKPSLCRHQSSMVGSQNAWKTKKRSKCLVTLEPFCVCWCFVCVDHKRWCFFSFLVHFSNPFSPPCLPRLTMLEQALANVMNFGLNCRQVIGPVCFPSNKATFIPLSAFHTWIFPSSEPEIYGQTKTNIWSKHDQQYDDKVLHSLKKIFICQNNCFCEAFHWLTDLLLNHWA